MNYSALYAKTSSFTNNIIAEFLNKYGNRLKWQNYKENVIEVGCGDGSVTRDVLYPFLKERVEKFEAIDMSESMVKYANSVNENENIHFVIADVLDKKYLESKENRLDHIFAFYCAHWIPDTRSLLEGFHKMLKPDGQVFMTTLLDAPFMQSFRRQLKEGTWDNYLPKKDCFANYTDNPRKYMRDLLENIGFKVDLCAAEENLDVIENFDDFTRALTHMFEFLDNLPDNLRETYIQEHIKNSCEASVYVGEPQKYEVPFKTLIIIASKKA